MNKTKITSPSVEKEMLDTKASTKSALQKKLGWASEPKRALVCIPTGLTKDLGGELFEEVLEGLLTLPIEILIVGKGSSSYGEMAQELIKKHEHRIAIIPNKKETKEEMYKASDMALFFCDPTDIEEVGMSLVYGAVPVAPKSKILQSYNPVQESGTAFLFDKKESWHCFAAIVRALETFIFPFDWKTIQKQCIKSVM